jgi:hypothetical protein
MKEKLWPSLVYMTHAKKVSTQKLIEYISEKIHENFIREVIIQNTNEKSIHAAAALWCPLEPSEMKTREESNRVDIQSYNNLMETFSALLKDDSLQVLSLCI